MTHGNKKYLFEELTTSGDKLLIKPNPGKIRVNLTSLKQQLKLYLIGNGGFNYNIEEHKNGNATITRIS